MLLPHSAQAMEDFQLVPLRWPVTTAVAGGMIGEIGALGGSILPNLLGQSRQRTGFYAARFILYAALALSILILMRIVSKRWTTTWVGGDGRALKEEEQLVIGVARRIAGGRMNDYPWSRGEPPYEGPEPPRRDRLPPHPLASHFPMLDRDSPESLRADR